MLYLHEDLGKLISEFFFFFNFIPQIMDPEIRMWKNSNQHYIKIIPHVVMCEDFYNFFKYLFHMFIHDKTFPGLNSACSYT